MSATSSLVIVEPSLEHDVHSRSASVDLVLVTSIRTLEHPLHLTHTRLLQSTLPPRGGGLKRNETTANVFSQGEQRNRRCTTSTGIYYSCFSSTSTFALTLETLSLPRPPRLDLNPPSPRPKV